jgi:hypothetical protein
MKATSWMALAMIAMLTGHLYLLDGLDGWLLSKGFAEESDYAAVYSDDAFRTVTHGMTTEEVLARLGAPLERGARDGARESWRWSRSRGDQSYRVRVVVFEANRVIAIYSEYDAD